jgi:Holliday junction DNA helicase RuvB
VRAHSPIDFGLGAAAVWPVADPDKPNITLVTSPPADPLAPEDWSEYKGQTELKHELEIRVKSARLRNEPLDHVLLLSGPGMGKTSIAHLIAKEMGSTLVTCPTPVSESTLINLVRGMSDKDVLFLDEVHQVAQARGQVEALLPLLTSRQTRHGEKLPAVTVVAATTESHKLPQPFIDRFPIRPTFSEYTIAEMREIVQSKAKALDVSLTLVDAHKLAKACDGVPRIATNLVRSARDLQVVNSRPAGWQETLKFSGIRPDGLMRDHENYVKVLYNLYPKQTSTGIVYQSGVANIAKSLGMNKEAVERLERPLIKKGFIELAGNGRRLTSAGLVMVRDIR